MPNTVGRGSGHPSRDDFIRFEKKVLYFRNIKVEGQKMKVSDKPPRLGLVRHLSFLGTGLLKVLGNPPFLWARPHFLMKEKGAADSTRL